MIKQIQIEAIGLDDLMTEFEGRMKRIVEKAITEKDDARDIFLPEAFSKRQTMIELSIGSQTLHALIEMGVLKMIDKKVSVESIKAYKAGNRKPFKSKPDDRKYY
jgi:hypothetical protein